jgi:putative transposase
MSESIMGTSDYNRFQWPCRSPVAAKSSSCRNAMPDHVHILLSVPPRYSTAMTVGYLKGKSAIRIHRDLSNFKGTLFGRSFWARGCFVSTVGLEESAIREYIQEQECHERAQEQDELKPN